MFAWEKVDVAVLCCAGIKVHVADMKVDVWKTPSFRTTVQHDDVRNVRNDFEHYIKTAVQMATFILKRSPLT